MAAREQLPYFRGSARQRGRGFGALAATIGRTAIPFISRYVVPAAKRVGKELLASAAPDIGDVITGKKNMKSFAKDVGSRTIRKQLGGGRKKKISRRKKSTRNSRVRRTRKDIFSKLK